MEKECEFALDLSVHLAARQQDQGEAQLGEVALGAPGRRQRRLAEDSLLGAVGDAALAGQAGTEGKHDGLEAQPQFIEQEPLACVTLHMGIYALQNLRLPLW